MRAVSFNRLPLRRRHGRSFATRRSRLVSMRTITLPRRLLKLHMSARAPDGAAAWSEAAPSACSNL